MPRPLTFPSQEGVRFCSEGGVIVMGSDSPHSTPRDSLLTIGQAARMTGVSAKAIRYYEDAGLLPRAARGVNRYRRFGESDLNRLKVLQQVRSLGVPLSTARELLVQAGDADTRCGDVQRQLLALVGQRLASLDEEIAALLRLRRAVRACQRMLAACHPAETVTLRTCPPSNCIVTRTLVADGGHEEKGEGCDAVCYAECC